jgi:predicted nucleic acid-binding protein
MKNSVLLDASCCIEIMMKRAKTKDVIKKLEDYGDKYISPTTIHILYYFAEKEKARENLVKNFLFNLGLAIFDETSLYTAQDIYNGKDMEDCLQIATAMTNGIKSIITLDKGMKRFKPYINVVIV